MLLAAGWCCLSSRVSSIHSIFHCSSWQGCHSLLRSPHPPLPSQLPAEPEPEPEPVPDSSSSHKSRSGGGTEGHTVVRALPAQKQWPRADRQGGEVTGSATCPEPRHMSPSWGEGQPSCSLGPRLIAWYLLIARS